MAEHCTVAMTAPVGTDPLDTEAWKPITSIVIDHPRTAAPPVRVLDPTPRRVSAAVDEFREAIAEAELAFEQQRRMMEQFADRIVYPRAHVLTPETRAIIAAAVRRG